MSELAIKSNYYTRIAGGIIENVYGDCPDNDPTCTAPHINKVYAAPKSGYTEIVCRGCGRAYPMGDSLNFIHAGYCSVEVKE